MFQIPVERRYQRGAAYVSEQTAIWKQLSHYRIGYILESQSPRSSFTRLKESSLCWQGFWDKCWFKFKMLKAILLSYNHRWWQHHKSISVISVKYLDKRILTIGYRFSHQGTHRRVFQGTTLCCVTYCRFQHGPCQQLSQRFALN